MNEFKVVSREVKTFIVEAECPKCKKGFLKNTGMCGSNMAGRWCVHECNECGFKDEIEGKGFPHKQFREANDD